MKNVLITGASSGIGKAIGDLLHSKGYHVVGTSREPLKVVSAFPLLSLDVRNPSSIQSCISQAIDYLGAIDVLVNNAGVGITGPVEEIPLDQIKNHFDVNFFGPVEVMKAILPHMRANRNGLIVNITSIAGYMGLPYRGVYSSAKSALEIIAESTSMEVKQFGIRVTCVAPGDFATNISKGRYHAPVLPGSPYKAYAQMLSTVNDHVQTGSHPDVMAHAVYEIIQKGNPKLHYKVGAFLQKLSVVLKRILPDLWYEKLLMRHYKL